MVNADGSTVTTGDEPTVASGRQSEATSEQKIVWRRWPVAAPAMLANRGHICRSHRSQALISEHGY
jgi:hypothetical protein